MATGSGPTREQSEKRRTCSSVLDVASTAVLHQEYVRVPVGVSYNMQLGEATCQQSSASQLTLENAAEGVHARTYMWGRSGDGVELMK